MQNHFGEIAGILTALFWTVTAMAFESAGKKVGSLSVNLIRLVMAFFLIGIYSWIARRSFCLGDFYIGQKKVKRRNKKVKRNHRISDADYDKKS